MYVLANVLPQMLSVSRPLTVEYLQDHFLKDQSILSPCKSLVRIGETNRTVGFFHSSASGFFQDRIEVLGLTHPHLHVSKICLAQFRYLDHTIDPRSSATAEVLEQNMASFPLLDYALKRFSYHARRAPELSLYDDFNRTFARRKTAQLPCRAMSLEVSARTLFMADYIASSLAYPPACGHGLACLARQNC